RCRTGVGPRGFAPPPSGGFAVCQESLLAHRVNRLLRASGLGTQSSETERSRDIAARRSRRLALLSGATASGSSAPASPVAPTRRRAGLLPPALRSCCAAQTSRPVRAPRGSGR